MPSYCLKAQFQVLPPTTCHRHGKREQACPTVPAPAACTCLNPCSTRCCLRSMMEQRSSPEHPQHHQPKPAPSIAPFSCLAKLCVVCACMQTCACVCLPAAALHAALHMPIALLCSACMPQVCFACAGIKLPFLHASQGFLAGLGGLRLPCC